jgi:hypothetical protein
MSDTTSTHYCISGSKRLRLAEPTLASLPSHKNSKCSNSATGEISFSSVRKKKGRRAAKGINVKPPPLPSTVSAFPIRSLPSSPQKLQSTPLSSPSQRCTARFLQEDPDLEIPNVSPSTQPLLSI